jgi:hypothetical protein
MRVSVALSVVGLAGAVIALGQVQVGADTGSSKPSHNPSVQDDGMKREYQPTGGMIGPDVMVWQVYGYQNYGPSGDYRAYAVGTKSCNVGDEELSWRDNGGDNRHPVIAQNLFRYHNGRFEQIGYSWLKHGFCALDGFECDSCQTNGDCDWLGIGCSDPYGASLNGSQSNAGPKFEVNAYTGVFPYPPSDPPYSGSVARRLKVALDDVDSDLFPGAQYVIEAQYVASDDAAAGNGGNNASYRPVNLSSSGAITGYAGSTVQTKPGIFAWKAMDEQVTIRRVTVPGEGTFYVGYRVYQDSDVGTYIYEYAVQNLNSDRSANGFEIPLPDGVSVSNMGFHDVDYHDGDGLGDQNVDGTDWTDSTSGGMISWSTDSFDDNENANAIRWGTAYNFRFTADSPPVETTGRLQLFKPGDPEFVEFTTLGPEIGTCIGDIDGSGVTDITDLLALLDAWGDPGGAADLNDDGIVNIFDLLLLIDDWGCSL